MTHIHALTWALKRVIIDVTDDVVEWTLSSRACLEPEMVEWPTKW